MTCWLPMEYNGRRPPRVIESKEPMQSESQPISSARMGMLAGAQVLGLLVALVWIVGAVFAWVPSLMSVMILDAPGSDESVFVMTLFLSFFTLPYVAVASGLMSLVPLGVSVWSLVVRSERWAFVSALLMGGVLCVPFVNVLAFGLAMLGINLFCPGDMTCF